MGHVSPYTEQTVGPCNEFHKRGFVNIYEKTHNVKINSGGATGGGGHEGISPEKKKFLPPVSPKIMC